MPHHRHQTTDPLNLSTTSTTTLETPVPVPVTEPETFALLRRQSLPMTPLTFDDEGVGLLWLVVVTVRVCSLLVTSLVYGTSRSFGSSPRPIPIAMLYTNQLSPFQ